MITIKFFSLLREAISTEQLEIPLPEAVNSIADLKTYLVEIHGDHWREALLQPNVVHALNQRVVEPNTTIADGDEIALFPPMTGG